MMKCPQCKSHKTGVEQLRDSDGKVVGSQSVCYECGNTWNRVIHR